MSSETNKSFDTGCGKTINILGGQIGTQANEHSLNNFNSASRIIHETTQGSNSHVIAHDYQDIRLSVSDELRQKLEILLSQLQVLSDDYPSMELVARAEEAVHAALSSHPDVKQIAILTETLKQDAGNISTSAAPLAKAALAIVHLLEQHF